ncbi:YcaO-like family protein [Candidatus Roizmanbacteria bacterium]|nr:YcaO-like family protein [Candidatus Roizmanbacteria bacterium]
MSNHSKHIDILIERGSQFINDNPKIIKRVYKDISYNDDPKLYNYAIYFKDKYSMPKNEDAIASGVSFNKKRALLKVLGETIERYSLSTNNNKKFIYKSYKELFSEGHSALNPNDIIQVLDKKIRPQNALLTKLHWLQGRSLLSNKNILIPAQLIYVPYVYEHAEVLLQRSISTGAAAGSSIDDALYRGICEIVERDAFMISYLNMIPSPQIDLSSTQDKEFNSIIKTFKRYKLELVILDLTTDLKIPVFAAIVLDRTRLGPAVSVGLKAGFNVKDTIIGAVEESLMVRFGTRDQFAYESLKYKGEKMISIIDDRARFWLPPSSIEYLVFWLKSKNFKKINTKDFDYAKNTLKMAIDLLKEKKMEPLYVDITDKITRKYGFIVLKVIIPQLHPLYLDERYPYLGGNRLYETPVKMGIFRKPKVENQLNKVLHPFL